MERGAGETSGKFPFQHLFAAPVPDLEVRSHKSPTVFSSRISRCQISHWLGCERADRDRLAGFGPERDRHP